MVMPIRRRLRQPYKVIPYHREYGPLSTPPIKYGFWPNGAFVVSDTVPGRKGKRVILGWMVKREMRGGYTSYGVWIANRIGWIERNIPVKYHNISPADNHQYVGEFDDHQVAMAELKEAWTELHGITLR